MATGRLTNVTLIVISMGSLTHAKLTATATVRLTTVRIWPTVMPMAFQMYVSLQKIAMDPVFRTAVSLRATTVTAMVFLMIASPTVTPMV